MNKQQTIELLESQIAGFFSKEQVIDIIKGIQEEEKGLGKDQVDLLIKVVGDRVGGVMDRANADDVVDLSSAEFDISYDNKLELSSVDLDLSGLCDKVRDAIENSITDYLGGI
jgi:hypothetical protein